MREYSRIQTLIANLPYGIMLLTGAGVIAWGFGFSAPAVAGAAGYVAYGIGGAVWIMVFVCRYCHYYDTRSCPCGYGVIAARLVRKGSQECFASKFKRHIPVIVPLWLIPFVCGAVALRHSFAPGLAWLLGAFLLNSFVVLPLVSRRHACSECPQKDDCPWMVKGRAPS
jgi:hypothetical protein